jgi:hypothetical protein
MQRLPKNEIKKLDLLKKLTNSKPMLQNLPLNMMLQAFFVELHIFAIVPYESIFALSQLPFKSLQCITSM